MPLSSPWTAPVLTLLTLAGALGAILDSNHRTAFVVFTTAVVLASLGLFTAQRILKRDLDWRLAAPLLLGTTALAAESSSTTYGLEMAGIFVVLAVTTYFLGRRERRLAAAAQATSSASLQIMAALLAFVGTTGGTYVAPVLLIAATVWLLIWMPSRTRRFRDQESLHLARSPEEVSAYLLDQRHLPLWFPGYVSSELLDGKDPGVGATYRQVIQPRGRALEAHVMIDEYERGHRLCTHVMEVPGRGRGCYSFSSEGGGTAATYDFDGELPYAGALIGSVLFAAEAQRKMRTQRRQAFDKLKSILEA